MKKLFALGVAIAMVAAFIPAVSGDTDTIDVTMNPQTSADIEVNESAWDPTCGIGGNESTSATWAICENNGTVQVDVNISASDTTDWTLASAPGDNQFNMSWTTDGSSYTELTTSEQAFATDMAHDGSETFGLRLYMPTSTVTNASQTSTITFTATVD